MAVDLSKVTFDPEAKPLAADEPRVGGLVDQVNRMLRDNEERAAMRLLAGRLDQLERSFKAWTGRQG